MVWRKQGLAKLKNVRDQVGDEVAKAVHRDAKRYCPVKTGQLRASIKWFKAGKTWYVTVSAPHWMYVEYSTRPHVIRSHGPWPLRNRETGQVFGPVVHHPGTTAQPFMRPAIYRTQVP